MSSNRVLVLFFIYFCLSGCATLDKKECKNADWKAIGFEDGSQGYELAKRFRQHRKSCAEYGIKAKFDFYEQGHSRGIRRYCTAEQGYNLGRTNRQFPAHCPSDLVELTRRGFNLGHNIYLEKQELNEQISALKSDQAELDNRLQELGHEREEHEKYLRIAEKGLANPTATDLEKVVFYTQRDNMKKLIRENEIEVEKAESEKEHYQYSITRIQKKIKALDDLPMPKLNP